MSYANLDAIWVTIAERIAGTNTVGPSGRVMPTSGDYVIRVDRLPGGDDWTNEDRAIAGAVASIDIELERSSQTTAQPGSVYLYDMRVKIKITYNLNDPADTAADYQADRSVAQRHPDMLTQAFGWPGALATVTTTTTLEGRTVTSGTATGIVSGMLMPASPGVAVVGDSVPGEKYEMEHTFGGFVLVTSAIA